MIWTLANFGLTLLSIASAAYGLITEQIVWVTYAIWAAVFTFGTAE